MCRDRQNCVVQGNGAVKSESILHRTKAASVVTTQQLSLRPSRTYGPAIAMVEVLCEVLHYDAADCVKAGQANVA